MAHIAGQAAGRAKEILTGFAGIEREIARIRQEQGIELGTVGAEDVRTQNVGSELAEKTAGVKYPSLYVYCESVTNLVREKFRSFSGKISMAVEVRVSHDRLEKVTDELMAYVGAVTNVLERNRGEWSPGLYYAGGYKVELGAVKPGGKHFIQTAKIRFDLDGSVD